MNKGKLENLQEIKHHIEPKKRIMGLDLGKKTIGLAISDINLRVATPVKNIIRGKFDNDIHEIKDLITSYNVGLIVVGNPITLKGEIGPMAQSVHDIANNIKKVTKIRVALWDERFSTLAVTRILKEANSSPSKIKNNKDMLAATYILQNALDFLSN